MATDGDEPGSHTGLADLVDQIVAEWDVVHPGLDVSPIEIITRLARLRAHFEAALAEVFGRYDLTNADFAVIAHLRRAGPPYQVSQSTLTARLGLTSGTISVRINRLVGKGIVTRTPDPEDARGVLVALTPRGLDLFDAVAPIHLANEHRLLSALGPDERRDLARLLRTLLVAFEHPAVMSPMGVTVAPAHRARATRASVGLRDEVGLLVTQVSPGSPAAVAGIAAGDLLVRLGGRPLRSAETLLQATAAGAATLDVEFLRGDASRRTTVAISGQWPGHAAGTRTAAGAGAGTDPDPR